MRSTLSAAVTGAYMHREASSVLAKIRQGIPLYEIAAEMGISTGDANEKMNAELKREKKRQEAAIEKQVLDQYALRQPDHLIASALNLSLTDIKRIVARNEARKTGVRLPKLKRYIQDERNADKDASLSAIHRNERNESVINAYRKGMSITEVAEHLFLKEGAVYYILRNAGIELRKKEQSPKQAKERKTPRASRIGTIISMFLEGKDEKAIAEVVNLKPFEVRYFLRMRDLMPPAPDPKERHKAIINDYKKGKETEEIAGIYNLKEISVRGILYSSGVKMRRRDPASLKMNRIVSLFKEGKDVDAIVNELQAEYYYIRRILVKNRLLPNAADIEKRNKAIIKAYKSGQDMKQVAEQFSVTAKVVQYVLSSRGVQLHGGLPRIRIKDGKRERLITKADLMMSKFKEGKTMEEIANELNSPLLHVRRVLMDNGLIENTREKKKLLREKAFALFSKGTPLKEIAASLGISRDEVRIMLYNHGVKAVRPETNTTRTIDLYLKGNAIEEISTLLNQQSKTTRRTLRQAGIIEYGYAHIPERNQKIVAGFKNGQSVKELGEKFEMSTAAVRLVLKKMNAWQV